MQAIQALKRLLFGAEPPKRSEVRRRPARDRARQPAARPPPTRPPALAGRGPQRARLRHARRRPHRQPRVSGRDQLGLYEALAAAGAAGLSAEALAAKIGAATPRYVAEWLRQQAAARLVLCNAAAERFWLSPAQVEVLARETGVDASPFYAAGAFEALPALTEFAAKRLPELVRSGGGADYDAYDDEHMTCGVRRELAVWQRHSLVDCLRSLPEAATRLASEGCVVADVGCGGGAAAILIALAFPNVRVVGIDTSAKALKVARERAAARSVADCVEFRDAGVEGAALPAAAFDLAFTHDAVHDMAKPRAVMAAVRRALKPGACWVLGDFKAAATHGENVAVNPLAALAYGYSCHLCLPSALSAPGAEGLGTLGLSAGLAEAMAREAGFSTFKVLAWDHPINRFYLLGVSTA
jgi:ubiquinone/menaquinone biosynthesis C-methylase UbiE